MGTISSVTTGIGFAVPHEVVAAYDAMHEDDDEYYFGDRLDRIFAAEPLLSYASAYYYDYTPSDYEKPAHAVFIKSTVHTKHGVGVFHPDYMGANSDEFQALRRAARELGIESPDITEIMVVSIG